MISLLVSFYGFVMLGSQNLTNPYNLLSIGFFLGGIVGLIYEANQIEISHIPIKLDWIDLGEEYTLSPSLENEENGLLRIFFKKSGFLKIVLNEIMINTPNYFKLKLKEGMATGRIQPEKVIDARYQYHIPMKRELRKFLLIGVDFRVKVSQGKSILNEEIDVIVKYDLKIRNIKILGCQETINIESIAHLTDSSS